MNDLDLTLKKQIMSYLIKYIIYYSQHNGKNNLKISPLSYD